MGNSQQRSGLPPGHFECNRDFATVGSKIVAIYGRTYPNDKGSWLLGRAQKVAIRPSRRLLCYGVISFVHGNCPLHLFVWSF